ncbi:MAG: hypothetical protein ABI234_09665 [Ktedonobacteraceae bacterium]
MFPIHKFAWGQPIFLLNVRVNLRFGCCSLKCSSILFLLFIPFIMLIWPGLVPFGLFQFWGWSGNLHDIAILFWPMLIIGLLITSIAAPTIRRHADIVLVNGRKNLFTGLGAGPLEELIYRWLLFYSALIFLPLANFITFGLVQWLYSTVFGPLADLFTFYQIHDYFFSNRYGWVVGAAILSSCRNFRDGHSYQGIIGWIWSWFGGIFLFMIMLHHGLFAAMLAHSLYNLCLLTLSWLIARMCMTPEEARKRVQEKMEIQRQTLQQLIPGIGGLSQKTIVDQAPPHASPTPFLSKSIDATHERSRSARLRQRLKHWLHSK